MPMLHIASELVFSSGPVAGCILELYGALHFLFSILSLSIYLYLSIYMSIGKLYQSIYLSTYSIHLFFRSVYLSFALFIYISICPWRLASTGPEQSPRRLPLLARTCLPGR